MNQCVPSWEIHDNQKLPLRSQPKFISVAPDVPTLDLDYEVAELTWENGHLAMHSLGPQRLPNKPQPPTKYTWDKPQANGTLESIVNQVHHKPTSGDEPPWFNHTTPKPPSISGSASTSTSPGMTMDALVPNNKNNNKKKRNRGEEPSSSHVLNSGIFHKCEVACSTPAGSCSGVARVPHSWSSRDPSVSGSATFGRDSRQVTLDTCETEVGVGGFTSTSMGSPGNTSSGKQCTADDHDSVCHSRPQREEDGEGDKKKAKVKSSALIKRSRAAAIHNQSERKRRDKINQRMKTLQKLVPNSSKTDKASMLDEVIEYLKQLQNQIQMMSRMNMSPMMLPLAMQQQLQMSMMAPMMGLGMGMGVMDINSISGRPNMAGIQPVLHPTAFMPMGTSWESAGDRLPTAAANVMHDPLAAFLACQSQPMTMDAYSRMVAMYQQMQQPPAPISKN